MTDSEVNKIIAEFMGEKFIRMYGDKIEVSLGFSNMGEETTFIKAYTKSLDLLVPVWEKARIVNVCTFDFHRIGNNYIFRIFQDRPDEDYGNEWYAKEPTLQQAAAHATAKAIQELNNESK